MSLHEAHIDAIFGIYIEEIRENLGLKRNDVARMTDLQSHRLAAIERGNVKIGIRKWECDQLARVYGVDADEMLLAASGDF